MTTATARPTDAIPVDECTAQWPVWSTTARLVVTDPPALPEARRLVEEHLAEVDAACSRFRPDSELSQASRRGGTTRLSPLLAELVAGSLAAARLTDGAVDPTVGAALSDLGYDADLATVLLRVDDAPPVRLRACHAPGWRQVRLDGDRLTVPAGVQLDLGATAKAQAADVAAARVSARLGVGALVSLGGDIATAGERAGGWQVVVQDQPDDAPVQVTLPPGAALATSSTRSRQWWRGQQRLHHVIDPRTSRPADRIWACVSVSGWTCLQANALSTAAVVKGVAAVSWLRRLGAPARLVDARSGLAITLGAWPGEVAS